MRHLPRAARATAAVLAAAACAGLLAACGTSAAPPPEPSCEVRAPGGGPLALEPAQAANAATIAGVARRLGLPDHAVTVALATAIQESKLHNLSYGDLDSLGLFQQRPSQGWGTAEQVSDPAYAAAAFYRRLTALPGWADLPVTTAAQQVQRSGFPEAYAQHEDAARLIARATTGQVPAALSCAHLVRGAGLQSAALARAAAEDLGPRGLQPGAGAPLWSSATWLVAHASSFGVTQVTAGDRRWTADAGAWAPLAPGPDPAALTWS